MKKLIVLLAALAIAPFSFAQSVSYTGLNHINRIINATPGVNVIGITDGVTVSAAGAVEVAADGLRIPVATSATATIGKTALAKAAGKFIFGASALGVAFQGYQIYQWYKDQGIATCAPPNFFCKPDPNAPVPAKMGWYKVGGFASSPAGPFDTYQAACTAAATASGYGTNFYYQFDHSSFYYNGTTYTDTTYCSTSGSNGVVNFGEYSTPATVTSCPTNYAISGSACVYTGPGTAPTGPAYTPDELQTAVTGTNWDPLRSKKMWDAIQADNAAHRLLDPATDIVPAASPVTWTAPPVTIPETVVKTATIPNADGSTSTETTKKSGTITPTPSGSTIGDAGIAYPTTITTTVTTVNNTTNQTTTNTTNNTTADPTPDPCADSPDRAGCHDLGAPPAVEPIPTQAIPVTVSPVSFASNASCPAPVTYNMGRFGGAQAISWQPFCDWASQIRAVFLACFAAATAWIFLEGMKSL